MSLCAEIITILEEQTTSYAVIGATAMAAAGVSRSTVDVDLLTLDVSVLRSMLWEQLAASGALIDIRHGDAQDPLAGLVRFEHEGERPVDLIVGKGAWQARLIERARPMLVMGIEAPVVGAADLVLLKLYAGGPQDRWDIAQLLEGPEEDAIRAGVAERMNELPDDAVSLWESFEG